MKRKRWRTPKAKPGELRVVWGKLKHSNPDICYVWGSGVHHGDGSFMHYALGVDRLERDYDKPNGMKHVPSVLKELEARGYDLTTLKFSIQQKPRACPENEA